jgi:hypothetical protein
MVTDYIPYFNGDFSLVYCLSSGSRISARLFSILVVPFTCLFSPASALGNGQSTRFFHPNKPNRPATMPYKYFYTLQPRLFTTPQSPPPPPPYHGATLGPNTTATCKYNRHGFLPAE